MVRLEKEYVFEGPNGRRTLADVFEGKRQLVEALVAKVLESCWAQSFNWNYWKDTSCELEPEHTRVARDVLAGQAVSHS